MNSNLVRCDYSNVHITPIEIKPEERFFDQVVKELHSVIKNNIVDEVVLLADFEMNDSLVKEIVNICKISGRKLKIVCENRFDIEKTQISIDKNRIVFEFKPLERSFAYRFLKRLIDIILSVIALIITFPLFIVIAILIKIDSPEGPIFFVQEGIGLNGRRFKLIKFRTMITMQNN